MKVETDRRYEFARPPAELWPALTSVGEYQAWWPWLRSFDGTEFASGETWRCVVKPPLPYEVRFTLQLEEVVSGRSAAASVTGDIRGTARLELSPTTDGSELHLVSVLEPASGLLRTVARVVHPVARFGHDWIIDTGLRQFESRAL